MLFLWNSVFASTEEYNLTSGDTLRNAALISSIDNISKYQTSVGYWNDNFFQDLLGKKVMQGKDDYVTASFWLQVVLENTKKWWIIDIYHNVLTNKSRNYRTDLLTLRLSIEKQTSIGSFQFGSGIITRGNYGGKAIQNGYHKLFDIEPVKLEYERKNDYGLIAFLRYEPVLWRTEHIIINGYAANSYKASIGPSNVRAGFEFNVTNCHKSKSSILHFQIRSGYIDYYRQGKYLSSMFDNGFSYGILTSWGCINKFNIATWITSNQYGQKQPHYGISCTFGWNGSRMSDLSDITFP